MDFFAEHTRYVVIAYAFSGIGLLALIIYTFACNRVMSKRVSELHERVDL